MMTLMQVDTTEQRVNDNDYNDVDSGDGDDNDDIYIMMSVCLFVCNEKSSLPPGSLL